jgi:molecular chaperone DnaK
LAKDDIDQMVKDAEAHAEEDRRKKEEAEVRNTADTLVYQTEKLMKEQGDKISGDEKEAVEAKLAELKTALEGTDLEVIKSGTEALMTASQTFAQRLYDAASQDGGSGGGGVGPEAASGPDDDEVVEAEIVEDEDGEEPQSA